MLDWKKILIAVAAGGGLLFCFLFFLVRGEGGVPEDGIQVSPVRFDWNLKNGEVAIGRVNLKNFSDKPYKVSLEIEDFYVSEDSNQANFFIPNEEHPLYAYDVINWIDMPDEVYLGPEENKWVEFKITVPPNTPTGGYYGGLFFKTEVVKMATEEGRVNIGVNQRTGVLLVMAVKGREPIIRSGELIDFRSLRKIYWTRPVRLMADVKNSGNLHYKAESHLEIHKFGQPLITEDFPGMVIYPDRSRVFDYEWDFSLWSFGFYRAVFSMRSEDGVIVANGVDYFWVIPWQTALAILGTLILVGSIWNFFGGKLEIRVKND